MSNSLADIKRAEKYVTGIMARKDAAKFEAVLLTDLESKVNVRFLQKTFVLLRLYRQKKIKQQAEAIHNRLFNHPDKQDYRDKIFQLFKQ